MTETITVKLNDEQMAKIIYKVTENLMLDANRIEVIRCKDCRWNSECRMLDDDNGFCSEAERKEE